MLSEKLFEIDRPEFGPNVSSSVAYREDIIEAVKELKKEIDICADETDIWDNERWNKFKRLLRKRIKYKIFGEFK